MTKKTIEQLLEEQNQLIREQNILLGRQVGEANYQSTIMDRAASVARWDAANPLGKYFWVNPNKR